MGLSRVAFRKKVLEGKTVFGKEQKSHSRLQVGV